MDKIEPTPPFYVTEYEAQYTWPNQSNMHSIITTPTKITTPEKPITKESKPALLRKFRNSRTSSSHRSDMSETSKHWEELRTALLRMYELGLDREMVIG